MCLGVGRGRRSFSTIVFAKKYVFEIPGQFLFFEIFYLHASKHINCIIIKIKKISLIGIISEMDFVLPVKKCSNNGRGPNPVWVSKLFTFIPAFFSRGTQAQHLTLCIVWCGVPWMDVMLWSVFTRQLYSHSQCVKLYSTCVHTTGAQRGHNIVMNRAGISA